MHAGPERFVQPHSVLKRSRSVNCLHNTSNIRHCVSFIHCGEWIYVVQQSLSCYCRKNCVLPISFIISKGECRTGSWMLHEPRSYKDQNDFNTKGQIFPLNPFNCSGQNNYIAYFLCILGNPLVLQAPTLSPLLHVRR